jgi:hypothetical protein
MRDAAPHDGEWVFAVNTPSRQAQWSKANRAAGRCSCGRKTAKAGRCARCYATHLDYMRAYMAKVRARKKSEK